jgi:hypothetical protein
MHHTPLAAARSQAAADWLPHSLGSLPCEIDQCIQVHLLHAGQGALVHILPLRLIQILLAVQAGGAGGQAGQAGRRGRQAGGTGRQSRQAGGE